LTPRSRKINGGGTANGDRFKFTGREYDSTSGLYYYRARYYDANIGSFISQDPLKFDARDENLHRYVGNKPTNATDASGFVDWSRWPTWLPRDTPPRGPGGIEEMIKAAKQANESKRVVELTRAKKIVEQVSRLAQKAAGRFRGGLGGFRGGAGCIIPPPELIDRIERDPRLAFYVNLEVIGCQYAAQRAISWFDKQRAASGRMCDEMRRGLDKVIENLRRAFDRMRDEMLRALLR
jgi:RHS repeat-associated protein